VSAPSRRRGSSYTPPRMDEDTNDPKSPSPVLAALHEMPLFPLTQVVLFPHAFMPLHVFEPRYRALVKDCLATHKVFALALITDPTALDANGNPPIADVAGVGLIVEHQALDDGRSVLLLHGQARVHLEELPFVPPYRRARATLLKERVAEVPEADRMALLASAAAFSAEVRKQDARFSFRMPEHVSSGALADHCAHHLVLDTAVRQAILRELDPRERVRSVMTELALQHSALLRETGGVLH
jgi:Lon protease-like protein